LLTTVPTRVSRLRSSSLLAIAERLDGGRFRSVLFAQPARPGLSDNENNCQAAAEIAAATMMTTVALSTALLPRALGRRSLQNANDSCPDLFRL
jgi:hypothetical protein